MKDFQTSLNANFVLKFCRSKGANGTTGMVANKALPLAKFLKLFDEPLVDTSVTFAQYMALDRDKKGDKKSAPGYWVAAHYADGRRRSENQRFRSGLVFDLDYVDIDQLDHIKSGGAEINRMFYFMHTTRAHCPEKPRVRIFVPTSRHTNATETHALTRLLAMELADDPDIAIEIPDLVSFNYNQAMFMPSRSKDQEYWTHTNDAPVLDVDDLLMQYPDWEDYTTLPYQSEEKQRGVIDPNRKMEHPHEKAGAIGAFCRTYSIEEAIAEFLPDEYEPGVGSTPSEVRYTRIGGGGANGAIVYDNGLFLHSWHGTDPAFGCHNAFDLVRLHKFGHLDENAKVNTSIGNLPSFKAMKKMADDDPAVANEAFAHLADEFDDDEDEPEDETPEDDDLLGAAPAAPVEDDEDDMLGPPPGEEKPYDITDEFDDDDTPPEPPKGKDKKKKKGDMSWTQNFRRKADGSLEVALNNAAEVCLNDVRLASAIGYDEFTMDPVCLKQIRASKLDLPSQPLNAREKKTGRKWTPEDDASISYIFSANAQRMGYETDMPDHLIQKAVLIAGHKNPIHPVRDMLQEHHRIWVLAGRKTGHIESLSEKYLHTSDSIFHKDSSRLFCIGAVARIMEPGCKFDQMLIIRGDTGGGKSTFLRNLAGGFFSEFRVDLDRVDRTVEQMRGNWILEMAEMAKARSDNNLLKDFLSAGSDTIRLAYGKREVKYLRQSVMAATSNDDTFLSDPTSVRRYWVWETDTNEEFQIDQKMLLANLHNIWGEAYQAYLDMREEQPKGDLHLGLQNHEAIVEQRQIAEGNRKQTVTEIIAEVLSEWLDAKALAHEVEVNEDGFALVDGDERVMIRNMVTPRDAYEALRHDVVLSAYRNADARTYSKAMKLVPGWTEMPKCHRYGQKSVWFYRVKDGPLWIEQSSDDLLK